jgi:membrane protease subunit HflK
MSKDDKRKNPWGQPNNSNDQGGGNRGPWGGGGGPGGQEPPDLDELLRRAQQNFRNVMPGDFRGGKVFALFGIAALALWLGSGFFVVNPGENAVIQQFGKHARTQTSPGLGYHLPAPIEKVTVINVEEIRKMNIGFTESFTRGGTTGARDVPEESLMLTADRNIVDLDLEIQWNIKSAEEFIFEIQDQENTIKRVAESAIREVVGQTNMFPIITTARDTIAASTKAIIQQNLDQYKSGVNITQILIQTAEVHPEVQSSFQDVQSAKQDAEDVQNRANQYRNDIIPKARGRAIQMLQEAEAYKQSQVAKAQGDAERFKSVYEAYLNGPAVTKERLYIETMEEVLKNAQKIILDDKGSQGVVPYLPLDALNPTRVAPKTTETQGEITP